MIYSVNTVNELKKIIIHFEEYLLLTQKRADYDLFKKVVFILDNKKHLTQKGLMEIVKIRASSNRGLSDELKIAFPNIFPVKRPLIVNQEIKDPNWIVGFTSGDGNFMIQTQKSSTHKLGNKVWLRFKISQHSRDSILLKNFIDYFDCGNIYTSKNFVWIKVEKR